MAKGKARCFGQDLMRGEHTVGEKTKPGLTWVGGDRSPEELDDTSKKIPAATSSGTSIFDPVLCELMYSWFCPIGGTVVDPFAGGSVRGIVASKTGRRYIGVDLRAEQVGANRDQAETICSDPMPVWVVGDSVNLVSLVGSDVRPDFVFSCPPYADLERYSDDPRDLSTMDYDDFLTAYNAIIGQCVGMLKDDAFACFVVGDVRDGMGFYRGFPWRTIAAFENAGAKLYNEAALVTAVGSLSIRVGRQFQASRKLGKTHQNVLVFCKGNPKKATAKLGPVVIPDVSDNPEPEDGAGE